MRCAVFKIKENVEENAKLGFTVTIIQISSNLHHMSPAIFQTA